MKIKPVENFRNHQAVKYDSWMSVFVVGGKLCLYTQEGAEEIFPVEIVYTNLGEPFVHLARFVFVVAGEGLQQEMDVHPSDIPRLILMCETVLGEILPIAEEVKKLYQSQNRSEVKC